MSFNSFETGDCGDNVDTVTLFLENLEEMYSDACFIILIHVDIKQHIFYTQNWKTHDYMKSSDISSIAKN